MTEASLIDWDLAGRVGARLVPPGPQATLAEMRQIVAELREAAASAPALVAEAALMPETGRARELVVDRPSGVKATVGTGQAMIERIGLASTDPTLGQRLQSAFSASMVGAVMAVLGTRILGQFDPFSASPRLVLVAPNIMAVERELNLVPRDFRMWVCLHEQTHRVQFSHAPWLVDHLVGLAATIVEGQEDGLNLADLPARLRAAMSSDDAPRADSLRVISALSNESVAEALDRITAVMSLLEGHADVMMDRAGPAVIKTLPTIRASFDKRRARGGMAGLVGKMLGMDAKMAQYRDGAEFCRVVINKAGVETLNLAFRSADDLPTITELHDPQAWLTRQGV